MRYRLYLDTSVLGALTDQEPIEWVKATETFFRLLESGRYAGCLSALVLEELGSAPDHVRNTISSRLKLLSMDILEETAESVTLAQAYVDQGIIPAKYVDDARHVAIATIAEVHALVSWNFRHLVNLDKRRKIDGINLLKGYHRLDIISPLEVCDEQE